jgi:hypothetical protein
LDSPDVDEAIKLANILTDGKLDGIPRRSNLGELVTTGTVKLESLLRIADRYCGANHLVFAIDTNFAGIKDTISNMVQQITSGGLTNVAIASSPPVTTDPQQAPTGSTATSTAAPILPFNKALTQMMQNRYAAVKTAVVSNDPQPSGPDGQDVDMTKNE